MMFKKLGVFSILHKDLKMHGGIMIEIPRTGHDSKILKYRSLEEHSG